MQRNRNKKILETKSVIQEIWPPKWFISYADLATLLMTLFIILAVLLSLKIPLYLLADKRTQELIKREYKKLEEIRLLRETMEAVLEPIGKITTEQLDKILTLRRLRDFTNFLRLYIKAKNLDKYISIVPRKFKLTIVPLETFLFKKGQTTLKPQAKEFLDKIALFMKDNPSIIQIEGHTDNTPIQTSEFSSNWELSVARANSILKYLTQEHNISPQRIYAIGYGEYRPVAPNDTEENKAKNRRVVFEIIPEIKKD